MPTRRNNGRDPSRERARDPIRIAIMGEPGVGKSSLITRLSRGNYVVGDDSIGGRGRRKAINTFNAYLPLPTSSLRIWTKFIDCPGFNDDELRPDQSTIDDILDWLGRTYRRGQKLHGIIYMVSVNNPRFTGFSARNIAMFKALLGEDFYKNVILCTTMWDELPIAEGIAREEELRTRPMIWLSLVRGGSKVFRVGDEQAHQRTPRGFLQNDSSLVYEIARNQPEWLLAQHELADNDFQPGRTSAYRVREDWTKFYARDEFLDAELDQRKHNKEEEVERHDARLRDARQRAKERMQEEISDETAAKIEEQRKLREKQEQKQKLEAQLAVRGARSAWAEEERELEKLRRQVREAEAEYESDSDSDDGRSGVGSAASTVRSQRHPGTVAAGWTKKKDSHGKTVRGIAYRRRP
ncbi:uncharacterized protein AB675_2326 [Cyphellophora attinorum]|uniref:G domain-containing protein n=1 Tax=Cyphellophora attinorum TaxID=1664694 RepID=A0A0N1HAG1_9EURO|nr:uncharacterized protein AB675_2326 [Phialophora attinorum]KPI44913.1 hypothetical protein AB675_2326 [Phialophora attinorum]